MICDSWRKSWTNAYKLPCDGFIMEDLLNEKKLNPINEIEHLLILISIWPNIGIKSSDSLSWSSKCLWDTPAFQNAHFLFVDITKKGVGGEVNVSLM